MQKVWIIDSGYGNVMAVTNLFRKQNLIPVEITRDLNRVSKDDVLVLSGVGTFGLGVDMLHKNEIFEKIVHHGHEGRKIIGICLGMQLLFHESQESPGKAGLRLIEGDVRINVERRSVIGWSGLKPLKLKSTFDDSWRFYFSHTYSVFPSQSNLILSQSKFSTNAAIISTENLVGFQFHPEKSQSSGKLLLQSYLLPFMLGKQCE